MTILAFLTLIEALITASGKFLISVKQFDPIAGAFSKAILSIPGNNRSLEVLFTPGGASAFCSWASGDNALAENVIIPSVNLPPKLGVLLTQLCFTHEITPGMKVSLSSSLITYSATALEVNAYDLNQPTIWLWKLNFIAPPPPM